VLPTPLPGQLWGIKKKGGWREKEKKITAKKLMKNNLCFVTESIHNYPNTKCTN
jgi:hypothetical protein